MSNLDALVKELQQERDRLDKAIAALTSLNGSTPQLSRGRTMSAVARRRISAAQKARWAKVKTKSTPASARPKRRISAAA
jgi:exonuclease VII small subunit